jgi:hypothetical protein
MGNGNDATERSGERILQNMEEFREAFDALMAPGGAEPEGGRIAELERLWHKLRTDNDAVVSDYVSEMIRETDEGEVVASKKASGRGRASSCAR